MSAIASGRRLSQVFGHWRLAGREQELADRGWQGKRPASGAAQVVGWVGDFWRLVTSPCWRFIDFLQRFQDIERRRTGKSRSFRP